MASKSILVGIDFTRADDLVLSHAKEFAKTLQAELHLLHAYTPADAFAGYLPYAYPGVDEREGELQAEKAKLKSLVDSLHEEGFEAKAFMKESVPTAGILEFAQKHDNDLIVIGTHSRNLLERALLGSTADRIVRKSTVPVLVVPTSSGG